MSTARDTHWTVCWTHEGHKFPTTNVHMTETAALKAGQFLRDMGVYGTSGIHIAKVEYGQGVALPTETWNPWVRKADVTPPTFTVQAVGHEDTTFTSENLWAVLHHGSYLTGLGHKHIRTTVTRDGITSLYYEDNEAEVAA